MGMFPTTKSLILDSKDLKAQVSSVGPSWREKEDVENLG